MALLRSTPAIPDSFFLVERLDEKPRVLSQTIIDNILEYWSLQNVLFVPSYGIDFLVLRHSLKRLKKIIISLREENVSREEFDNFVKEYRSQHQFDAPRINYKIVPLSLLLWKKIYAEKSLFLLRACQAISVFDIRHLKLLNVTWDDFTISQQIILANVILAAFLWAKLIQKYTSTSPFEKCLPLEQLEEIEKYFYSKKLHTVTFPYDDSLEPIANFVDFLSENVTKRAVKLYMRVSNIKLNELTVDQQLYLRLVLVQNRMRAINSVFSYGSCIDENEYN